MSEPVLTLKGACVSNPPAGCVSSLTREQFEQLTNALQPADKGPVPPDVKRKFAAQYAKLLTFADAARALGLENDPKVQQIFAFARNQILAESLNQHYMEEYAHPTDQQIQEYYDQNSKKYLEATLLRIIIPKAQATADKPKPSDADEQAYAEKIRQRWIAGEDPTKLQKEAMEHSGISTPPPDVNVGARRPGSLPEAHEAVFEFEAGRSFAIVQRRGRVLFLQGGFGAPGSVERSKDHHLFSATAAVVHRQDPASTERGHAGSERRLLWTGSAPNGAAHKHHPSWWTAHAGQRGASRSLWSS